MKTIKDVARLSGVSLTTVSRVINGSEKVSKKTKDKVDQAIRELGYFPNNAARSLVKKQTDSIAVLLRNIHDPFFCDLIRGIEEASLELGRNVIFCSLGKDEKIRDRYIEYLTNGISDAIVLYGSLFSDKAMIEHLHRVQFPLLLVENNFQTLPLNQFLIDNVTGARDAVFYLIRHGHKRIAHVMGNPNKKVILERFSGYTEAMQENGLTIQSSYIQNTLNNSVLSLPQFQEMMKAPNRPTAVFCSDDKIAIQVINALGDLGFSVPGDVSVVGFDNLKSYDHSYRGPRITSVQQPLYEIGHDSIVSLDRILKGEESGLISKCYKTTLAEHDTVGIWHEGEGVDL
ncbi:MAG: LacI family transcriptional regulator [Lachnospiraceae bacterium]|jgi:DNA-binding LacI/PurR family transcriptional regulator|nr:LacI family transcriptional regulator [Lachnospiraceae bacterium]